MSRLTNLPPGYADTRDELQRIAVHVVARARQEATGRFGLRVTPGGFGTPSVGDDVRRVRVSGDALVVERAGRDGASTSSRTIDAASLAELADLAGVDLDRPLDVGHDTPPVGDPARPIVIEPTAASAVAVWFDVVARALDRTVAGLDEVASPSSVQLWPEHFDVAIDVEASPEVRVNLGGSPGDGFHGAPYAYVGPWTGERPGPDDGFWNAPFGAVLTHGDLLGADDPVDAVAEFYGAGLARFAP